ncbi:MAG: glycoside hydrolase N-terminal domain-containing protein [Bacteroides sp.]|nr:glycoside hydrolase N-terminal domain-containing protein [Bacteroides sp.]MCM1448507.1 glycoside hydrolase N-terminal domain-containing protein [Bacteroides sp.]MCM1516767.1 glycoside hydrolase N-terminal domain-containing protein [Paraprevotella sp.]
MKKLLLVGLASLLACCQPQEKTQEMKLWYDHPADATATDNPNGWADDIHWHNALPLGNGSLGAMVFGDVSIERIQLNEESMWSGCVQDSDNPEAAKHLDEIRALLFAGKYAEASQLTNQTQVCNGSGSATGNAAHSPFGCFQTLGDLWIDFDNKAEYTNYYRELNMSTGTVTVSYTQGDVDYKREIFISQPDQVMAMRMTASKDKQLSFTCNMTRPECYETLSESNDQLIMQGALPDGKGGHNLQYMARLKAIPVGGTVSATDSTLTVKEADEVILLMSASTSYMPCYPTYNGRDYTGITKKNIDNASVKKFSALHKAHCKEHAQYFDRAQFHLATDADTIPTDILVKEAKEGKVNPHLYELLFQYGRYLLIASSRPGTLPANLQGIWANKIQTPWNGDFHTDVNVEMNYWLAEATGLSDMHMPLFDLIESLVKPGEKTAHVQYGKKGWVVHPITNVWGYTSPGEAASWGMHTGASAWICQHIGEHYRFTGDKEFLRRMYPTLKGAVEFYLSWLVPDPNSGKLVSGPAVSPENTFVAPDGSYCQISMGPTHDQQVIWQLFDDFGMVSEELSISDDFTRQVAESKANLAGTKVGSDGRIMEWAEEWKEIEPGHRHISHLFAIHPGAQINLLQTPDLAQAAKKSMDYRIFHGGGHTGWSAAWLVSQYARLHSGKDALKGLDIVAKRNLMPNLFALHPPFQIDANFGVVAGITEMLIQSHVYDGKAYVIQLLPALPSEWQEGSYTGLHARGGFEIDASWADGTLKTLEVKSLLGNPLRLWYNGEYLEVPALKVGETWKKSFHEIYK